jgi:haloacetate dehalogenase
MAIHPIEDWQEKCTQTVTGNSLPAGHFIPEQTPGLLSQEMMHFFASQ